jgi:hypothetical protein
MAAGATETAGVAGVEFGSGGADVADDLEANLVAPAAE